MNIKIAHQEALISPDPDPASIYDFVLPEPYISKNIPRVVTIITVRKKS